MSETLPVSFTPRASRHVDEAAHWWRRNRPKAPEAFDQDLQGAVELISRQPYVGAIARNVRLRTVRRVYMDRIRYYLYYRVRGTPPHQIEVVAFWHASRGSGPRI